MPVPNAKFPGDYHEIVTRVPVKFDSSLMKEPRAIAGAPRAEPRKKGFLRKQVPSMMLGSTPISPVSPDGSG